MLWVKRIFLGLGLVVLTLAIAAGGLWWATKGHHNPRATVVDDPELPAFEVQGIRLHGRVSGPDDAPLIVALHGGPGGDHRSLLGLETLTDDYRVLFYDQRGAGLSQRVGPEALTIDGYLAELGAVIDRFSPDDPVILVGHSWGAMLASAFLGASPERVSRAVLIEPGFLDATGFAEWSEQAGALMSGPAFYWQATVAAVTASHVDGPDEDAAQDVIYGHMVHRFANHADNPYHCRNSDYDAPSWRFGARASQQANQTSAAELDRIGLGAAFTGPVLFMAGSCDTWIGAEVQGRHATRFANADLVVIEGAGHEVLWDQPDAAIRAIRNFVTD